MWLAERAKQGTPVPSTLPSDLIPAPVGTSDFLRRSSFEDKRKENFERGRMELERRKREIQERQDREKVQYCMFSYCMYCKLVGSVLYERHDIHTYSMSSCIRFGYLMCYTVLMQAEQERQRQEEEEKRQRER